MRIRWLWALLATALIVITTLTPTDAGGGGGGLCILCGSRGLSDFVLNLLLFAPLGLALGFLGFGAAIALAAGAALSLSIEIAQIGLVPGRDASLGDLLSNSLGAAVGAFAWSRARWIRTPRPHSGRWAAIGLVALLLTGLELLAPALPRSTWHAQWTAEFGNMDMYRGTILGTWIGDVDVGGPPWRIRNSDVVRDALASGAPVRVHMVAGPPPAGTAPIFSIYDDRTRDVLMIAASGVDLVHWHRLRADALRLDRARTRIPGAFAGATAGDTVTVSVTSDRMATCIAVDAAGSDSDALCQPGFTIGDTWTLLYSMRGAVNAIVSVLWLFGVTGLVVYLAGAVPGVMISAGALALLAIAPRAMGFPFTPWWQLVSIGLALPLSAVLLRVIVARGRGANAAEAPTAVSR